jgi:hypothetical protein
MIPRIPPGERLEAADFPGQHGLLILESALAASSADLRTEQRADLAAIVAETAAAMCEGPDPATALQAWVLAHHAGFTHSELSRQTPEEFLVKLPLAVIAEQNRPLMRQVKAIAATQYGVSMPT